MILKPPYKPIDVSSWDDSGRGYNIQNLLNPLEKTIWDMALPHQDKRGDVGHAEHVTYFVLKLLQYFPNADRSVVIPAAILHDTGWNLIPPEDLALFRDSLSISYEEFKRQEPRLRELHQKAGAEFSQRMLENIEYEPEEIPKIAEIVSKHDTRKGFLNVNDGIMRDADKLWRYSFRHWEMYIKGVKDGEEAVQRIINDIDKEGFFYSDISRQIARIEMEQTLRLARRN